MTLTTADIVIFFSVMLLAAIIPGLSVVLVSTRSLAYGFNHGILATFGIMAGDMIFILLAISGLSILSGVSEKILLLLKYIGCGYLVWMGIQLLQSYSRTIYKSNTSQSSLTASFMSGLLMTMADQKALLFYLVFLPSFLDIPRVTMVDTGIILLMAFISIGVTKIGYAFLAYKGLSFVANTMVINKLNSILGIIIIGAGVFLFLI